MNNIEETSFFEDKLILHKMNPTIVLLSIYHVPIINYAWGTEKSCQPLKLPNTKYIYCQLQITAKTITDF